MNASTGMDSSTCWIVSSKGSTPLVKSDKELARLCRCLAQAVFAKTVSWHRYGPENHKEDQHITCATTMVSPLHSCFPSLLGVQPSSQWLPTTIAVLRPEKWDNKPSRSVIVDWWQKWYYCSEIREFPAGAIDGGAGFLLSNVVMTQRTTWADKNHFMSAL